MPTTTLFCRPSSAPAAPDRTSQTASDRSAPRTAGNITTKPHHRQQYHYQRRGNPPARQRRCFSAVPPPLPPHQIEPAIPPQPPGKNTKPHPADNNIATHLRIRRQYLNQTAPPATTSLSTARQPARMPTTTLFCRPSSAPAAPDRTSQTASDHLTKTPNLTQPATISPRACTSAGKIAPPPNGLFICHFCRQAKPTKTNPPSHKQTTKQGSALKNNPCFFISYSGLYSAKRRFYDTSPVTGSTFSALSSSSPISSSVRWPASARIFRSISSASAGLSRRTCLAFSRPCPSLSPL